MSVSKTHTSSAAPRATGLAGKGQIKPMTGWHVSLALFIAIVWGVNFVAAKAAVLHFPTFMLLTLRVAMVAVLLAPFLRVRQMPMKKMFYISCTLAVLHFGLTYIALEYGLDVSVAVMVDQLRVPFAVLLGVMLFNEKLDKKGVIGLGLALAGTFVIAGSPNAINNVVPFVMMLAACFFWAVYNIQIKHMGSIDVLAFIAWVSVLALPQLAVLSWVLEDNHVRILLEAPMSAVMSLLYITIAATIVAHGSWYYLLRHYAIGQVVPYSLLVPVFGMIAGVLLLDEVMTLTLMLGSVLIIIGVTVIVLKKPTSARGGDAT